MLSKHTEAKGGSVAIDETASQSLNRMPPSQALIGQLQMTTLFYLNIVVLSVIWVMSGVSSLLSFEQSQVLVQAVGLPNQLGDAAIVVASMGDIVLGLLMWFSGLRRWVLYTQFVVIAVYSIIIAIFLPEFWLHPFTPIIKNLAMIVLGLYLVVGESK
ncbi:MAG: hypothetical protein HN395_05905 [Methylococcales bacterium]|nr:hypothetical protein [Methylococcales bacterium]MBT5231889.1 hypothetical protein [Methylococcales bacterium]MBT7443783.1 hypothetical protein [Methylococcales bacterium]